MEPGPGVGHCVPDHCCAICIGRDICRSGDDPFDWPSRQRGRCGQRQKAWVKDRQIDSVLLMGRQVGARTGLLCLQLVSVSMVLPVLLLCNGQFDFALLLPAYTELARK